ncbi:hypothetical protein [Polaromonas sp. YR568]|uniref:hypothetical protein n=1 Tax=Polaromonas sp. YR568 TaxID=1855301 RepID=UPI003137AE92
MNHTTTHTIDHVMSDTHTEAHTETHTDIAGRSCPLRYRYGPHAIATAPQHPADTLYVIGGLYGNLPALDVIERMAAKEAGPVTLCFNGDFNWFNIDDDGFRAINQRVLQHHAITGNVEAELSSAGDEAGCGCAYPDQVDAAVVERSNRIHARLKATAQRHAALTARLDRLPMFARYDVGDCRVGVVHGDAESLAGWRFGVDEINRPEHAAWLRNAFEAARVDVFASSHTCEPLLKPLRANGRDAAVINNGAAGMPNAGGKWPGLITRIGRTPSPHVVAYGSRVAGAWVDALPVAYDQARWKRLFLSNWPERSDAHTSYFARINGLQA